MESKDKILDKIKKLLKLQSSAESLGNEGEAYAAANAVHRLLTAYNLTLGDIASDVNDRLNIIESEEISYRSPYGSRWKRDLLALVTANNYCKAFVISGRQHMQVVGQEDNVAVIKNLYTYLVSSFTSLALRRRVEFDNLLLLEGQRLTDRGRKKFLHSYFVGAVAGLRENFESHEPTSEENGLIICHNGAIKDFLDKNPNYINQNFKGRESKESLMLEGVFYGHKDGRNISLNRQIQR